jgi:hypothetical protein
MPEKAGVKKGEGIKHWCQLKQGAAFWGQMNQWGLSNEQVHEALRVESVKDFEGSKNEAIACVKLWLDQQTAEEEEMEDWGDEGITTPLPAPAMSDDILARLAAPFPLDAVSIRPGATTRDKTRCLALAYADIRAYIDRLNEVVGLDWADDYEVRQEGERTLVVCRLRIGGAVRTDVGEQTASKDKGKGGDDEGGDRNANITTTAAAQAFKRACVKFNLGRYLYDLPNTWVDFDAQKKRITPQGEAYIRGIIAEKFGTPAPTPAMSPGEAALQVTSKGTPLGTLTQEQLQLLVNKAHLSSVSPILVDGAKALLRFLGEKAGPNKPDATYRSITGTQ